MKLKVCGMKYKDNIEAVAKLQPDFLGFIFYEKSARQFTTTIPELPNTVKKVGVFVNEKLEIVLDTVKKFNLQLVQLHGHESPEYCAAINHVDVIKVFSIKDEFNFNKLKPFEEVCNFFLFDTKGKLPGGNGFSFDWDILKNYTSTKPYFLSGGIGIEDIEKIKEFKKSPASKYCYAIDVNSKFEREAGLKNIEELEKFKYELQH